MKYLAYNSHDFVVFTNLKSINDALRQGHKLLDDNTDDPTEIEIYTTEAEKELEFDHELGGIS